MVKEVFNKIADVFSVIWIIGIFVLFAFIVIRIMMVALSLSWVKAILIFLGVLAFLIISALCQSRLERLGEDTNE